MDPRPGPIPKAIMVQKIENPREIRSFLHAAMISLRHPNMVGLINQVLLAYKEDVCRRLKEFALEE